MMHVQAPNPRVYDRIALERHALNKHVNTYTPVGQTKGHGKKVRAATARTIQKRAAVKNYRSLHWIPLPSHCVARQMTIYMSSSG